MNDSEAGTSKTQAKLIATCETLHGQITKRLSNQKLSTDQLNALGQALNQCISAYRSSECYDSTCERRNRE